MALLPSTPVDDNTLHLVVPAIANIKAPKLTELSAVGVLDVSCYLVTPWNMGAEQASITDQRACGNEDGVAPGKVTRSLELQYIENPGSTTDNKAYDGLLDGALKFFVQRRGKPNASPLAVGDMVTIQYARTGLRIPVAESGQVMRVNQRMFPVPGGYAEQVAIVA